MATHTYKRLTDTKRSLFIPLGVTLVLLLVAGFLIISYFNDFYHTEKTYEATLLAQGYANTLGSTLDARALLEEQFQKTLRVAGDIVGRQERPFSNEMLSDLAKALNVDVFYVYDNTVKVEYSSDNMYLGWVAPEGHPVREFYESGLEHLDDTLRRETVSGIYWLYSYQRLGDGRMLQTGILADKLAKLYARLNEQEIIDQITKENPRTQIAFINPENLIIASSIPEEVGQSVDETALTSAMGERPSQHTYIHEGLTWHLKLYIPIQVKDTEVGLLALLFDLTNTHLLFVRIASTTIAVLFVLFILFSLNIIHIARKNKRIFSIAYFDEITGLPNIGFLKKVLEEQDQTQLALLIIDPLHFKFINLIYGYNFGDTLLHQIAQNLTSISLKGVTLQAYRFTDAQFIFTVKNYGSRETLNSLCDKILSIDEQQVLSGSVDLTIGITEWQKKSVDFDTIIKEASIALHTTDKSNRIQFYSKELGEQILRKDTIENELKRVVAGEEGILYLAYQPIVNANDGSILSFEALSRIQSSTLGSVSPLEFIAIAEERHLIIPLGKIILEQAAALLWKLTDLGYGTFPIAVNVSALQLFNEVFATTLQEITKKAGIETHQLEIELTESVFSHNFELLTQQIQSIHDLGIRIAIDDFGTGFSSLSRLEGLAVDVLKLDKQFVDRLSDPMAKGMSSDIISMGHHLGKHIVAEGVETEEQRQLLLDMGCDYMQGYLFSRPVSEDEVISLVSKQEGSR